MSEIIEKVRELSGIKAQIARLTERKKELEAFFLERGNGDVADTKYKSRTYADDESQAAVTYTEAQALEITSPNYLAEALGESVFKDIFTDVIKREIKPRSKDIERMLVGIFTGGYIRAAPLRRQGKGGARKKAQGRKVRDRPG